MKQPNVYTQAGLFDTASQVVNMPTKRKQHTRQRTTTDVLTLLFRIERCSP